MFNTLAFPRALRLVCSVSILFISSALQGATTGVLVYLGLGAGTSSAYRATAIGQPWAAVAAFNLPDIGSSAFPVLADLDGDGNLDALVGESGGHVLAFRNTGTNSAPVWVRQTAWEPAIDFGSQAAPALGDLDGDGDLDLMVGNSAGEVLAVENVGTRFAPVWAAKPAWNIASLGSYAHPALGDVNGDGKPELVVGLSVGSAVGFRGTGSASAPFVRDTAFDLPDLGTNIAIAFGDLNGDGSVDLLVCDNAAHLIAAYQNSGGVLVRQAAWYVSVDAGSGPGGIAFTLVDLSVPTPTPTPTASQTPNVSQTPTPTPTPTPSQTPNTTQTPTPSRTPTPSKTPTPSRTPTPSQTPNVSQTPTPTRTPTPSKTPTPTPANKPPVAILNAIPPSGAAPLTVQFDATGSSDPEGAILSYAWDFGDGTTTLAPPSDPSAAVTQARDDYTLADNTRAAGNKGASIPLYLAASHEFYVLTGIHQVSPFAAHNGELTMIDQVSRYYLMKIGHDLGALYYYNSAAVHGLEGCDRYQTSYLYLLDSEKQAALGGFPGLTDINGTSADLQLALNQLTSLGCEVPAYREMFVPDGAVPSSASVSHDYTSDGSYVARVTVSDGSLSSSATVTITVGNVPPPPPPGDEPVEGFGATTTGGEGGLEIHVQTVADLRAAVTQAKTRSDGGLKTKIVFDAPGTYVLTSGILVEANDLTIEGNGATLLGSGTLAASVNGMLDIRGHDVIVRNMRLRNGGDNLRAQGDLARNIVFSHISSTGSMDDGISIGYGAQNVTVQYCFLSGNTRSIFIKYGATTNVSIHHTWVNKQWIRGPLVSGSAFVDLRNNIVQDWVDWGVRFESSSRGNIVNSIFQLSSYAKTTWNNPGNGLNIQVTPVYSSGVVYRDSAIFDSRGTGTSATELTAPHVTTLSVSEMEPIVRAHAGCMPRDAWDQAYIDLATGWSIRDGHPLRITP